jgi:hypothetical protein
VFTVNNATLANFTAIYLTDESPSCTDLSQVWRMEYLSKKLQHLKEIPIRCNYQFAIDVENLTFLQLSRKYCCFIDTSQTYLFTLGVGNERWTYEIHVNPTSNSGVFLHVRKIQSFIPFPCHFYQIAQEIQVRNLVRIFSLRKLDSLHG